ncbi:ATP-dependent helicase/nuclease subunit A [Azospirillaceae bacterium]
MCPLATTPASFSSPSAPPSLSPDALQRSASDPTASVWVGASAGSGKTKVLTDRVLRLMLAGTPPHRILCLTFTKAAAAEMSNRIGRTLGRWTTLTDDPLTAELTALTGAHPDEETRQQARRLFAHVVDCPGGMKIQTIHGFCQSLLRRFPLEANLAPHFEVMDERTSKELLVGARDELLTEARKNPDQALGQALARLTADLHEDAFSAITAELTAERGRLRRLFERFGGLDGTVAMLCQWLEVPVGEDEASAIKNSCVNDAFDYPGLQMATRVLLAGSEADQERGYGVQTWLEAPPEIRAEHFEEYARLYLTEKGSIRKTLLTKKPATLYPAALESLQKEGERIVAAQKRQKAAGVATSTEALLTFAEALLTHYARLKEERALLDYDDLVLGALSLLTAGQRAAWVLFKLDGGLDHILIDEAQDTNPEQWQVVACLAEEFFAGQGARDDVIRTIFAVGDEKQSIFSFQRADPSEFGRLRRLFEQRVTTAERTWRQVALDVSFRSTPAVLSIVDAIFSNPEARNGLTLDPQTPIRHRAFRSGQAGHVEIWPPAIPAETAELAPWQAPIATESLDSPATRLAVLIAETIRGWIANQETLPSRGRPIQAGDVLVLVRRRTNFVAELVRALKDRNVPVAGVDRMILTRQLAVMDLMALAAFLLLPDDDLTLATVLKGPLIKITEEQLFSLAYGRRRRLWPALLEKAKESPGIFQPAAQYLSGLLARADFVAPYELFAGILGSSCPADPISGERAILGRLGPDARDPIDEFLSACLSFENTHPPALQGFLHWMEAGESEIKRELDQGGGQVRVMTVHGAKGLQAPIVFMPDTMTAPVQSPRILWPDEQRPIPLFAARRTQEESKCIEARGAANQRRDQEYRRLLYVALTRAEDRLYVCGWQGQRTPPDHCWHRLVTAGALSLAKSGDSRISPQAFDFSERVSGSWSGSGWVLSDSQQAPPRDDFAAASKIDFKSPPPPWWRTEPPPEPNPPRPLVPSRPDDPEPPVRSPVGEDDGYCYRRGILIHRLLQTLPDLIPEAREAAARRWLANPSHNLSIRQQDEMTAEVLAVIHHPEFAPLFGSGSQAEVPIVGLIGEGSGTRALSGQIDRLLVLKKEVWIIDYKTQRPAPLTPEETPTAYRQQLAAYRAALRLIYPDKAIRCLLLWTDAPRLMEIPFL